MNKKKAREFSQEFKVAAVLRMNAGESTARLAEELGVRRKLLYEWKQRMEAGGAENLNRKAGRPRRSAAVREQQRENHQSQRIAALERLVGKQQALIAFFERALQAVERLPTSEAGPAVTAAGKAPSSTASGARGSRKP
jgi:transposase